MPPQDRRPASSSIGICAVLGALIFASLARPVAAQAPWKTLQWEVSCTLELEGMIYSTPEQRGPYVDRLLEAVGTSSYASEAEARAAATQDLDSQLRRAEQCLQDDPVGIRRLAKDQLETSSRWLESMGFGGPVISPFPREGVAEGLFDPARAYRCTGTYCAAIEFIPHAHAQYVPSDMYLSLGLRWPRALAPDIALHAGNADAAYTPTHELFHAIQFGYQNRIPTENPGLWRWLLEGSAELVQQVAAERWGAVVAIVAEHRYYDDALHEPPTTENGPKFRQWAYGTWYFWDYLGRRLESPDRIQYLREVLGQDLSAKYGLVGVDKALVSLGTPGLYDLYPAFVADRLREARFFRSLALDESNGCVPPSLELTLGDSVRVSSCPLEMATEAFVVRTTVAAGRVGGLKIRIPRDADDPAYHLIVDGMRADVVDPLGAFPGGERNLFLTEVPEGRDSVLVRVVNVPKDMADGMVLKDAQVDVILTEVETCNPHTMMAAVHPAARMLLLPPDEYRREHEPDPGLHPVVSELRIQGLVNDGGRACAHPLGRGIDFNEAPDPDIGERMKRRLADMSPREMQELGQRVAREMGGRVTPEALLRALEAQPIADSVAERGTLLHIFSPNAVYWQRAASPTPKQALQAQLGAREDGPVVPWSHSGVGGWQPNSGAHAIIVIPDVPPTEFEEGRTYPAVGAMQYSRGEGVLKRSRRNTTAQSSSVWQGLEGWIEQVAPALAANEMYNFRGTVTIEWKTPTAVRGTFTLSGNAVYGREECPPNPQNLPSVSAGCRGEQRNGTVRIEGWFEAPSRKPAR